MTPPPDEAREAERLVAPEAPSRAAGRERADAAAMVEAHADFVFNLAVRLTGSRDEAGDLAQEVFVRILRSGGTFRAESSERTWVARVVINCHRNRSRWWRRLKRGPAVSLDQPAAGSSLAPGDTVGSTIADPAPGPEQVAQGRQAGRRLMEELTRLPRDQRAALILREVEGMSYEEIARAMGVREGTVKSRLSRARDTLRRTLADLASPPLSGTEEP